MTVKPVPEGYATVTPWIISRDTAQLIDFVKEAFDAEETARLAGSDGRIEHAEVRIGDSVVMMFDARPDWPPTPATSPAAAAGTPPSVTPTTTPGCSQAAGLVSPSAPRVSRSASPGSASPPGPAGPQRSWTSPPSYPPSS
jgi:hypothetical protein